MHKSMLNSFTLQQYNTAMHINTNSIKMQTTTVCIASYVLAAMQQCNSPKSKQTKEPINEMKMKELHVANSCYIATMQHKHKNSEAKKPIK